MTSAKTRTSVAIPANRHVQEGQTAMTERIINGQTLKKPLDTPEAAVSVVADGVQTERDQLHR